MSNALVALDALHELDVVFFVEDEVVGNHVLVNAGVEVFLSIEHPFWHAEFGGVFDHFVEFFGDVFAEVADFAKAVDFCDVADGDREWDADAADVLKGVDYCFFSFKVGVRDADKVSEFCHVCV